jgi:hypothetical protein
MILVIKAYCNAVAPKLGGSRNTEACELTINGKTFVDWVDFITKHRDQLDRQFLKMPNHITVLCRKWSDVLRKKENLAIGKELKKQLSEQLSGVPNADALVAEVMNCNNLAEALQMCGDNVAMRVRRGGHGRRDSGAGSSIGFVAESCDETMTSNCVDEEVSTLPEVVAYPLSVMSQLSNPPTVLEASVTTALERTEACSSVELHTYSPSIDHLQATMTGLAYELPDVRSEPVVRLAPSWSMGIDAFADVLSPDYASEETVQQRRARQRKMQEDRLRILEGAEGPSAQIQSVLWEETVDEDGHLPGAWPEEEGVWLSCSRPPERAPSPLRIGPPHRIRPPLF